MASEKLIKVLIDTGEELHHIEGHTVIGGVILLPVDSPLQVVTPFEYGRGSAGDWCSMIVTSIKKARQACKLKGIPDHIMLSAIDHAIKEGLERKD